MKYHLLLLFIVTLFERTFSSFSYAKFESADSGKIHYSIKHNPNNFLHEPNIISYLEENTSSDTYNEPSQRSSIYDNSIQHGKIPVNDNVWKTSADFELINELFRPGKLAPSKLCDGEFCKEEDLHNQKDICDENKPCTTTSPNSRNRLNFKPSGTSGKKIRFPEDKGKGSSRLNTRSRELGMSSKLRHSMAKTSQQTTALPGLKFITFETISLIPKNKYF